jgi:hypothetical protein
MWAVHSLEILAYCWLTGNAELPIRQPGPLSDAGFRFPFCFHEIGENVIDARQVTLAF